MLCQLVEECTIGRMNISVKYAVIFFENGFEPERGQLLIMVRKKFAVQCVDFSSLWIGLIFCAQLIKTFAQMKF